MKIKLHKSKIVRKVHIANVQRKNLFSTNFKNRKVTIKFSVIFSKYVVHVDSYVCRLESISPVISSNLSFALKSKQNNCCINRDYWEHNTTTRCLQVQNVTDLRLSYIETKSNIKEEEDEWSNNYQIRPLRKLQRKKSKLCSLDRMDPKHFLLAIFEMMERKNC